MELADFNAAKPLQTQIDEITAIQAKIAESDTEPWLYIVKGTEQAISGSKLKTIIGDSAYNTITAAALTSLNTQLATKKTTLQGAFDALGAG